MVNHSNSTCCSGLTDTWPVWAVATQKFMTADVHSVFLWGNSKPEIEILCGRQLGLTAWEGPVLIKHTWLKPLSYSSMLLICDLCFCSGIYFPCNHELKKIKSRVSWMALSVFWVIPLRIMFFRDCLPHEEYSVFGFFLARGYQILKSKHSFPLFFLTVDFGFLFPL